MQVTRRARLQAVIQEELSVVVPREVKDPRIPTVTFTQVEVTTDGSQATVYVSILGSLASPPASEEEEKERNLEMQKCLAGLTSATGFLRRHLARALTVRHIPNLTFKEDKGLANATRVYELLNQMGTKSGSSGSTAS